MYTELIHALQHRNWTVDTNLDHHHLHDVLPPSKPPTATPSQADLDSEEENSDSVPEPKTPATFPGNISPRTLWDLKRALILKNSHVGGHKYAGNVIVSETLPFFFEINSAFVPLDTGLCDL